MSYPNRTVAEPLASSHPPRSATQGPEHHAPPERTGHLSISELSGGPSTLSSRKPRRISPPSTESEQPSSVKARERQPSSHSLTEVLRETDSMLSAAQPPSLGPQYTRTGRISKAKKGLKVHNCHCGRSYTRAEHLRRHQKNHDEEPLRCEYAECGRTFHRADLLQRHQERHTEVRRDTPRGNPHMGPSPSLSSHSTFQSSGASTPYVPSMMYPSTSTAQSDSYSDLGLGKTRPFVTSHPLLRSVAPISSESSAPYQYSWCPSPEESVTSDQIAPEYTEGIVPLYDGYRHRSLSTAPAVDPWAPYVSETPPSPLSDTSSLQQSWTDADYSQSMMGMSMAMTTAAYDYPGVTASTPSKAYPGYVAYPMTPKTAEERDLGERRILFPEGQVYGIGYESNESNAYLDSYWSYFHPVFPIIHKPSATDPIPLLKAAMMAVGAQYAKQANGRADSRDLHERCLKLLPQRSMDPHIPLRTGDTQALFLIEFLSLFRARRGKYHLSPSFKNIYTSLTQDPDVLTFARLDGATHPDSRQRFEKWHEWINISTKQRLLSACYILESQQATLLARKPLSSHTNSTSRDSATSGMDLPIPASTALWDAENASIWSTAAHTGSNAQLFVYDVLMDIPAARSFRASDPFQSALLIATHHATVGTPDAADLANLTHTLDPSISTQLLFHSYTLAREVPLRDLLAVSGESWILGEKVPSRDAYGAHKHNLRTWLEAIWSPTPPRGHTHPSSRLPSRSSTPAPPSSASAVSTALHSTLLILRLALTTTPSHSLLPAPEMGLYFAVLTLWSLISLSTSRSQIPQAGGPLLPLPQTVDPSAAMGIPEMDREIREWLYTTTADSLLSSLRDPGLNQASLSQYQRVVSLLLRRTKMRLCAGTGIASLGELLDGCVGVLGKLGGRGWGGEVF